MVRIDSMKYLVNFVIKKQGWSEITDIESNLDDHDAKIEAREKAAEMLKQRILNDGIYLLINKSEVQIFPMELEKVKK